MYKKKLFKCNIVSDKIFTDKSYCNTNHFYIASLNRNDNKTFLALMNLNHLAQNLNNFTEEKKLIKNNQIDQEKLINKIRKLFALSRSPNQAEAQAAVNKANDLLVKYNLSLNNIKKKNMAIKEISVKENTTKSTWRIELLISLAKHNLCETLFYIDKNYEYTVIGRQPNAIIVKEMFQYLEKAIMRISKEKMPINSNRNYREKFRQGMVHGIKDNLNRQTLINNKNSDSKALIYAAFENSRLEIQKFLQDRDIEDMSLKFGKANINALYKGFDAGKTVNLDKQITNN